MYNRRVLLKAILLGESGVGKTSLLDRYVGDKFSLLYKATIGANFLTKEVEVNQKQLVTLQLWDTAGQERFQTLTTSYYRGADCCILVFDLTIKDTFDKLSFWRTEFLNNVGISGTDAESYPFIVIGNKIDREFERAVDKKTVENWCKDKGIQVYIEASAKDSTNVKTAFERAAEIALTQKPISSQNQIIPSEGVNLENTQKVKGDCPC